MNQETAAPPTHYDDLRLIAVCYRAIAGIVCAAAFLSVSAAMAGDSSWVPAAVTWFAQPAYVPVPVALRSWFAGAVLTAAIVEGILLVATGRFLERNEHAPFVLVIATITAAFFPLGTVLGGVTLWRVISHTASGSPRE